MQGCRWSEPFDSQDRSCKSYQEVKYILWSTNHVEKIKKIKNTSIPRKTLCLNLYIVGFVINFAESELEFREREFQTEKRKKDFREFFSFDFQ